MRRLVAGLLFVGALTAAGPAQAQVGRNLRAAGLIGPANVVAGQQLSFEITVESTGAQATGNFQYRLLLTAGGILSGSTVLGTYSASSLSAGAVGTYTQTVTVPANVSGIFQPALVVDPAGSVSERNELDNSFVAADTLRVAARAPNLYFASATTSAQDGQAGDSFQIDFAIRDIGQLGSIVEIGAYLSPDPEITSSDLPLGRITVEADLLTGAADQLITLIPADVAVGDYYLGLILDPDQVTGDSTPLNNVFSFPDPFIIHTDTLSLDTEAVTDGTLGIRYEVILGASGGDGSYLYGLSQGALPDGLTLSSNGVLAGVPTRTGRFGFGIQVQSHGLSATRSYTAEIQSTNAMLEIVTPLARDGYLLMPYEQRLVAGGGEGPYSWFVAEDGGLLPEGLDLTSEGVLSGLPSQLGIYDFRIGVRDRLGAVDTNDYRVQITPTAGVLVLLSMPPPVPVEVPVDFALAATGGQQPYRWTALSRPPPGLTVTEDGHLRGTPTEIGEFKVLVRATGSGRDPTSDQALIAVRVEETGSFGLKTQSLPNPVLRSRYETFLEAEGGTPPYSYRLVPGTQLPDGFYLTQEGAPEGQARLYGLGYREETRGFAVRVEDSVGRTREIALALTIERPSAGATENGCTCTRRPASGTVGFLGLGLGLALFLRRRR